MKTILIALLLSPIASYASLFLRGEGLIYDDTQNITWIQDANYAATLYDKSNGSQGFYQGKSSWNQAKSFASELTYAGFSDWRLPKMRDSGIPGCDDFSWSGTDCGMNVDPSSSELAHLWYVTLGNLAYRDSSSEIQNGWGLSNSGPFTNLTSNNGRWLDTAIQGTAWCFEIFSGAQQMCSENFAQAGIWLVRDGDVAPIPEPSTLSLLAIGLFLISLVKQSNSAPRAAAKLKSMLNQ